MTQLILARSVNAGRGAAIANRNKTGAGTSRNRNGGAMIEQLSLFSPPRSEPEPARPEAVNPYENTWWKPKQDYRYNENGRDSGWVRITQKYVACVFYDEERRKLYAAWYGAEDGHACGWYWIPEKDLTFFFEQIPEPEWLNDD